MAFSVSALILLQFYHDLHGHPLCTSFNRNCFFGVFIAQHKGLAQIYHSCPYGSLHLPDFSGGKRRAVHRHLGSQDHRSQEPGTKNQFSPTESLAPRFLLSKMKSKIDTPPSLLLKVQDGSHWFMSLSYPKLKLSEGQRVL